MENEDKFELFVSNCSERSWLIFLASLDVEWLHGWKARWIAKKKNSIAEFLAKKTSWCEWPGRKLNARDLHLVKIKWWFIILITLFGLLWNYKGGFVSLGFIVPLKNVSLIWRRHHYFCSLAAGIRALNLPLAGPKLKPTAPPQRSTLTSIYNKK